MSKSLNFFQKFEFQPGNVNTLKWWIFLTRLPINLIGLVQLKRYYGMTNRK